MNMSGDAAEQVVRLSLEGTEMALRLSGDAAKSVAIAIYTILKNKDKTKTKGHQRLSAMLKSGKPLKVFTIKADQLRQFASEAKRYGVVYCALQEKGQSKDGMVDVMVRAEDASKIDRIVERFKLTTVDAAAIKHDIEQSRAERDEALPPPEHTRPGRDSMDELVDEMLSPPGKEARSPANPTATRTENTAPSAPTSKTPSKAAEGTAKERPSVREALRQIAAERQQREDRPAADRPLSRSGAAPRHLKPSEKSKVR